jgi:hypothetical protein
MASKNLIAGFKATGIYPIDKNKVISKLPTIQTNLDESTSSEINVSKWCKTFEQLYQTQYQMKQITKAMKNTLTLISHLQVNVIFQMLR